MKNKVLFLLSILMFIYVVNVAPIEVDKINLFHTNSLNYSKVIGTCHEIEYDESKWYYKDINNPYNQCNINIPNYSFNIDERNFDYIIDILRKNESSKNPSTVLIGDSITTYYAEYFDLDDNVLDIGIPGFSSYGVYKFLNTIYFTSINTSKVDKVIITLGTNDGLISTQYDQYTFKYTVDIINSIVERIAIDNEKINIYVVAPFPTTQKSYLDIGLNTTENIDEYSEVLKENLNPKAKYININDSLRDEEGDLDLKYTKDGVHPNKEGYKVIEEEIKKAINEYEKSEQSIQ